ncbi:MAG: protein-tyrosine-phosphatase [Planctomycetota bacterium]
MRITAVDRRSIGAAILALGLTAACSRTDARPTQAQDMAHPNTATLDAYLQERESELDAIDPERRALLDQLAGHVAERSDDSGEIRLLFVCTHNSRRSQLAQVWARAAAERVGVERVETSSAGTEATAFHPNAVAALSRAGFEIDRTTDGPNPTYEIHVPGAASPIACRSKALSDDSLPAGDFIALMTCSDANAACPFVPGAAERLSVTYEDPRVADGTDRAAEAYDERSAQIAREMLYVFRSVGD